MLRFYTLSCLLNIYGNWGKRFKKKRNRKIVMKKGPFYTDTHTHLRSTEQRYILSFNETLLNSNLSRSNFFIRKIIVLCKYISFLTMLSAVLYYSFFFQHINFLFFGIVEVNLQNT